MTLPVFFGHDTTPAMDQVGVGDALCLGGDEGRHAAKVRRLHVGEGLDVVNGCGLRLRSEVSAADASSITMRITQVLREDEPATRLVLVQALAKGGRDEQAIETATEIGVDQVIPWQAQRSIVKWVGSKTSRALAKWESVIAAAAKQSRRAWLPQVHAPVDSHGLAQWIARTTDSGGIVYIAHEAARATLSEDLHSRSWSHPAQRGVDNPPPVIAVIVGPEGGISDEERDLFSAHGAVEILLGPHVLRSSSAGSAALTLISAALGRW